MTTSSPARVTVRRQRQVQGRLQDHVLAWARDTTSGRLRYIMELGASERGAACGCTCISCSQPLVAVNAAKSEWAIRPHFRHESGTETHSCQVLSARAALLASLHEGDMIVLPHLRRSVSVLGLSGASYEGWVEIAPQSVQVGQVRFTDTTTAEVLLDDGRRLKVVVTGSASYTDARSDGEMAVPSIEICIDDAALATLSPEELRSRLVPALEAGLWCGHWRDVVGDATAHEDALRAAGDALDWDADTDALPGDLRRESLLHREVKAILATARSVLLPGWWTTATGSIATNPARPTKVMLAGARLEKKLGRIIPDVIAELKSGGELLVEVTVTNTITTERLERIRAVDLPTIEIDFSRMAGMLSRATLRDLVLDDTAGKTWLHHPAALGAPVLAIPPPVVNVSTFDFGSERTGDADKYKRDVLATSPETWGRRYLDAVRDLAHIDYVVDQDEMWDPSAERRKAFAAVQAAADALHVHGYPEGLDYRLFDDQRTMLHRLMSIMMGEPVAYRYSKVWQVINSMLTDTSPEAMSWHGLYLLAIQARGDGMGLTDKQMERVEEWRNEVRESLKRNDDTYKRDRRYDQLFALLFPDLVPGIDNLRLKRSPTPEPERRPIGNADWYDDRLFEAPGNGRWTWALPTAVRIHEMEREASGARIDGWAMDDTSVLYHLLREKHSTPYVSVMAGIVGARLGASPAAVLRFLSRNGYITLKSGG